MERLPGISWRYHLSLLQQFCAEHPCLPTARAVYKGAKLGAWCHTQRRAYKGSGTYRRLSAAMVQALEAVPGWQWKATPLTWEQNHELLQRYVAEHRQIPPQDVTFQGARLGVWCHSQRQTHKGTNDCRPLTAERVQALEAVPGWQWRFR